MARTIVVERFGSFVGKRSERLFVRGPGVAKARAPARSRGTDEQGEAAARIEQPSAPAVTPKVSSERDEFELPLFQVGEIVLPPRGVTVSVDLLAEAAERGISVSFLNRSGKPYALLSSPMLTATVSTRREQLRALDDERGAEVCRRVVAGKLRNQAGLLGYFAKGLPATESDRRRRVLGAAAVLRRARSEATRVKGSSADFVRPILMGIEGAGGRTYWEGISALLDGRCEFEGRRRQGDVGRVNALLNYGYGILYSRVWGATLHAGLDPFAGFLHTDRPGKPSLVLDLVEELRAPVVDRAVIAYVGLGRPVRFDGKQLDETTRSAIATAVIERFEGPVRYRGKTLRLASVLQHQVRSLATFLRREGEWRPFTMYW